jgi:hypothetical protein
MVVGLEVFKEKFSCFNGQYTLIGGVACGLLMNEANLKFRETKDFDIVLILEALTNDFSNALWAFIKEGEYEYREKSTDKPTFYRFSNPKKANFPKIIELFSRNTTILDYPNDLNIIPLHLSDELSSLSAILMDENYYEFLLNGLFMIDNIQVLGEIHIIPFKAKAWLDLVQRKEKGMPIDSKNINKHKNDIFRLSQLLSENTIIVLPTDIKNDMISFISSMENIDINLTDIGVIGTTKNKVLKLLRTIYT